jgi:DNA-binding NtrC family response regulator/PAS domain-containing protein
MSTQLMNTQLQIEPKLRRTGIGVVGDVPWGTHFFLFYEAKEDLLETLVPYFRAGLEDGEYCMWVVPEPLTQPEALNALRRAIPDFDRYRAEPNMELVQGHQWYLHDNQLDVAMVAQKWNQKLDYALSHGYSGLRLAGSTAWLAKKDWKEFCEYEKEVNDHILDSAMTALCTYPLHGSAAAEILDVTRTHQFAIARRQGGWEVVETSELKQAKAEIKKLNDELEQRVVDRTTQLLVANEELKAEMERRRRTEEELRRSEAFLAEGQRLSRTGSWSWNAATGEAHWSEEHFLIFGFKFGEVKPTYEALLERIHPDDRPMVERIIQESADRKEDFDCEYRIVIPGGPTKYARSVGHMFVNSTGQVECTGSVMDITEQHRAQASLQTAFEEIQTLQHQLYKENLVLREEVDRASMFEEIVGASSGLQRVIARISKVAPTDSTVLITGETGTGKELIARAIHKRSKRAGRAFVSVNCAALPQSLIGSELFGHEKGAFTGAQQRRLGRFELADGGTIFLDEVGELPAETQIALLRVLQEREFERVGGSHPISVNVRVLAATNRDLNAAMSAGTFRTDLFYRLSVFPIDVPSIRERKEDIPILVEYFIKRYADKLGKKIHRIEKKTLDLFETYHWPGNIRELQNVIERSVIVCGSEVFSVDESWLSPEIPQPHEPTMLLPDRLLVQERQMIESALIACEGRISGPTGAAARLGIPPSTLDSRIKSLNILKDRFRFRAS